MEQSAITARRAFLLAWVLLGFAKFALVLGVQPFGDEAFYWMESQRLALAYSDLPGLTAWLIFLGELVTDGVMALRWPFLLMGLLIPWQVVWLSRCWFNASTSWLAGLLALLMPLTGLLGVLALPDVPLTVATLMCLHAAARLQHHISPSALIQLGSGLAMGAFCHYRFAVVVAALALGLLLSGALPRLLRSAGFQCAIAIGAAAWLPLVLFNVRHAGAGIGFQLVDRHPWSFQSDGLLQPLVQSVVVSPLLYVLLLAALWHAYCRWRELGAGPDGLRFGFALVPVLGYFALGFFADSERVSFHWVLPGYLPLLAQVANELDRSTMLRRATLVSAAGVALLAFTYLTAAALPGGGILPVLQGKWFPANLSGWREIARVVHRQAAELPPSGVIVADNFMLAAQLELALGMERPIYSLDHPLNRKHGRAMQLQIWQRDAKALAALPRGTPAVFVAEQTATKPSLQPAWQRDWCDQFATLNHLGALSLHEGQKRFLVYRASTGNMPPADCVRPALARFYRIEAGDMLRGSFNLRGWAFKDGSGIEAVEISLDGEPLTEARYGLPADHVQESWPDSDDPNHPNVGFQALLDLSGRTPGTYRLGIRVYAAGMWEEVHTLPVRVVEDPDSP